MKLTKSQIQEISKIEAEQKELDKKEKDLKEQRKEYMKSNVYIKGDSIHQRLNKEIDDAIKAYNKLTEKLDLIY